MSGAELVIKGGRVIDPSSGTDGRLDVLIRRGKIAEVARGLASRPGLRGVPCLDARGCWVVPGLIDMHAHLRDFGRSGDETFATGTRAAAEGGVTTVLTMPNTLPVVDTPARVRRLLAKARRESAVTVLAAGAVTLGQKGLRLADLEGLAFAGAAAFSDDGRPVMDAGLMLRALAASRRFGLPVLDHAEDLGLSGRGVVHESRLAEKLGLPGIPSASEAVMALRDAALARAAGGALHICHVSCAETVAVIREAKRLGIRITGEAAPHHFSLTVGDIPERARPGGAEAPPCRASRGLLGARPARVRPEDYKMNPPLRGRGDLLAVIEGLADGTLDAIATDHAPHCARSKCRGLLRAPFGIIGFETLVPLSLALVEKGRLTPRRLIDSLTAAPARILGLRAKGRFAKGADGDATLIDPELRREVPSASASKSRNSPFVGLRLKGWARATVVAGRVVFDRGARQ